MIIMVMSDEEKRRYSDELERQAQEYKRSDVYQKAVAEKRARQKKAPLPSPIRGDVMGSKADIAERLVKRYESGEIPEDVSAEIIESETTPGKYEVYFIETSLGPSSIKYYETQQIEKVAPIPEGQLQYTYDVGTVEYPEQVRDIEAWAKERGARVRRIPGDPGDPGPGIELRIESATPLEEDASIDIRSEEMIKESRIEKMGRPTGKNIYKEATLLEKPLIHVRTLLSPAGYEYVGAVVRERADPLLGIAIDTVFPDIKSSEQVVKEDITRRTKRAATGKTTYNIMGVEVDERIVSAVHNPVVDVLSMAVGGAGIAKFAATKVGAKILTSTAGKVAAVGITGAYVGERGFKVVTLKAAGEETQALGVAATTVAGLGAGALAYKAEISHVVSARAEKVVELRYSELEGASVSKPIGKKTTVSRGLFRITEGELKGLVGQTAAISGKKGGIVKTMIPKQKLGKTTIEAQSHDTFVKSGVVSKKLELSYRKGSDWLFQVGEKTKLIGPRKEEAMFQVVAKGKGKLGGTDVSVKKFSGVSVGKTAKEYDFYLVQQGEKAVMVESSVIGRKELAKVDWVDIHLQPTRGGPKDFKISTAGKTETIPKTDVTTPPPAPSGSIKVKTEPPVVSIKPAIAPSPPADIKTVDTSPKTEPVAVVTSALETRASQRRRSVLSEIESAKIGQALINVRVVDVGSKLEQVSVPVISTITPTKTTTREREIVVTDLVRTMETLPPVPTPRFPEIGPPITIIPGAPRITLPFLHLGIVRFKKRLYVPSVKTNPVPDIKDLI